MIPFMTRDVLTTGIKERAAALGFDACGVASVRDEADDGFDAWLDAGCHADMAWLARSRDVRQHVALKVADARSVVALARYYFHDSAVAAHGAPRIARYAWSRDYHKVLAKPLKQLAAHISECFPDARHYASVDSGPVRERVWAARAGIGWIGRNGLVIHPHFGSWCSLATIITTAPLTPDTPVPDGCGNCRACIAACPTGAIRADRTVDARRCIAYHTVENRDAIPPAIAERMGSWVFGCDCCQEACPWNRQQRLENAAVEPRAAFAALDPAELATLSEDVFHKLFDGVPVKRARREGIARNASILLRNRA